ncbi:MAG: Rrf2 family transcriptional regulator [Lachnospiraceae bacterium]|nr:Rrf2 family transcriptional regulator [Lachnospiraceae bacterium]
MRISTKGRYAIRLMIDLAEHNNGTPVSLKEVAARQSISEKYLEQIISLLNKAGFVKSIRGAQGGYLLMGQPEDYTVGRILRLTENVLAPAEAEEEDLPGIVVTNLVWKRMDEAIAQVIDHVTIADLITWEQELGGTYMI